MHGQETRRIQSHTKLLQDKATQVKARYLRPNAPLTRFAFRPCRLAVAGAGAAKARQAHSNGGRC